MTGEIWRSKTPAFIQLTGYIKKQKDTRPAEILKIEKNEKGFYEVKVRNYLFKNGILSEKDKLISLSLIENQRSFENPWSHSISNIEVK